MRKSNIGVILRRELCIPSFCVDASSVHDLFPCVSLFVLGVIPLRYHISMCIPPSGDYAKEAYRAVGDTMQVYG